MIEQGTHESLVKAGGLYAQLYSKQASYYESEPSEAGLQTAMPDEVTDSGPATSPSAI